jgi:hypothetical protein
MVLLCELKAWFKENHSLNLSQGKNTSFAFVEYIMHEAW